jgi:hypothetical protein
LLVVERAAEQLSIEFRPASRLQILRRSQGETASGHGMILGILKRGVCKNRRFQRYACLDLTEATSDGSCTGTGVLKNWFFEMVFPVDPVTFKTPIGASLI